MAIPCLISYRGVWVNIICVLGTSCNYQIPDYVIEIVSCNNDGIEGRWSLSGKDSDDSRMQCLKSV